MRRQVLLLAGLAILNSNAFADEKSRDKSGRPQIQATENSVTDHPKFDTPFVIPLPKDTSDFSVNPPPSGIILNPATESRPNYSNPYTNDFPIYVPRFPLHQSYVDTLRIAPVWKLNNTRLSEILSLIERVHKSRIVMCFSPQMLEDVKIDMRLKGGTTEEKLNRLTVLGLVWRRIGAVYYVAWDQADLPSLNRY